MQFLKLFALSSAAATAVAAPIIRKEAQTAERAIQSIVTTPETRFTPPVEMEPKDIFMASNNQKWPQWGAMPLKELFPNHAVDLRGFSPETVDTLDSMRYTTRHDATREHELFEREDKSKLNDIIELLKANNNVQELLKVNNEDAFLKSALSYKNPHSPKCDN